MTTGNGNKPNALPSTTPAERRRSPLPIALIATLFIVVTFLTWHGTWFGNDLSDADIEKYLQDEKKPQHVQHALAQIEARIERKDAGVKRWYPQVVTLSNSTVAEIRKTTAWVMGNDNTSEEFHRALRRLLNDPQPSVRRNAAVQLASFKDADARTELREMLQPYSVIAASEGAINSTLAEGAQVKEGTLLARIKQNNGGLQELRSPLPGKISSVVARENAKVAVGDAVFVISPDDGYAYEALRALFVVGEREDVSAIERYAQSLDSSHERVKQQAALTVKAIQSRAEK